MAGVRLQIRPEDGWAVLPSSLKRPDGTPRFHLAFPPTLDDEGARALIRGELTQGYEPPTRNLLEKILRRGDLFVDVGAHWGLFTLQAASHPCGDVRAIAFEPDSWNGTILFKNIHTNRLGHAADLVCAACGEAAEIAPLVTNSSMGHSIRGIGLPPKVAGFPPKWVPVVRLDVALAGLPDSASRRLVIKVDAEGFDPQVVLGAQALIEAGRVAAIVWERAEVYAGASPAAMTRMLELLQERGFRHLRPPEQTVDGPLTAFDPASAFRGNVFSVTAGIAP